MENKKPHTQFHFGHLGLIAVCALLLVAVTWLQSGFSISFGQKTKSQDAKKLLTYEQAKEQVYAQNQPELESELAQNANAAAEQVALIDPNLSGQVLGASTEEDLFPKAQTLFTSELLDSIKINRLEASNAEEVKKYSESVMLIEAEHNALQILADLNSADYKVLSTVMERAKVLVSALAAVPVPKELEEYHKLKMIYFVTLGNIAQNLAGDGADVDADSATTIMFSITQRLEIISAEIFNKYQVSI